jgi:hypothetical protein
VAQLLIGLLMLCDAEEGGKLFAIDILGAILVELALNCR